MDRIMVAVAIGMALVFAIGVVLGIIAMISVASNREDRLEQAARRIGPPAPARGWPHGPETGPDDEPDQPPWSRSRGN